MNDATDTRSPESTHLMSKVSRGSLAYSLTTPMKMAWALFHGRFTRSSHKKECWKTNNPLKGLEHSATHIVDLRSQNLVQNRQYRDTVTCLPAHNEQRFVKVADVRIICTRSGCIVILLPPTHQQGSRNNQGHIPKTGCRRMPRTARRTCNVRGVSTV